MMLDMTKDQRTIAKQRERIEELEETVRWFRDEFADLKKSLIPILTVPAEWGLRPSHAVIVMALYQSPSGSLTHDQLLLALSSESEDEAKKLVHTQVCTLRRKLKESSIPVEIKTRWGQGYEITRASKDVIKAALERRAQP